MLDKSHRLTKNRYFQYIYKRGSKVSGYNITIIYAPTKIHPFKIGFTVSNKVGDAVHRNKVKRRLRAIIRELVPRIEQKYNYIVLVRPKVAQMSYEQIKKEMLYVLNKGSLLK